MAAPKGNNLNPKGRPRKEIDWEQFEQLCAIHCTQSEIASFFRVHRETLADRVKSEYGDDYSTVYKSFQEVGKCSLRRYQFVQAKKNASMAIWLGKQWLDQRDKEHDEEREKKLGNSIDELNTNMKQIRGNQHV